MTQTRRGFLGLMVAAPVIAPAVARQASSARYLTGYGEILAEDGAVLMSGFSDYRWPNVSIDGSVMRDTLDTSLQKLRVLMRSQAPWDVPNRLCGARINDDGEAV